MDLRGEGEAQRLRGRAGASGRGARGGGGAGDLILSSMPAREVRGRRAPVPTCVAGTRKGDEAGGLGRRLASWARWAGLAYELGRLVEWGRFFSFSFLYFYFLVYFTLKYLGTL